MLQRYSLRPIYVLLIVGLAACSSDQTGSTEPARAERPQEPMIHDEAGLVPATPLTSSAYVANQAVVTGTSTYVGPAQANAVTSTTAFTTTAAPAGLVGGAPLFVLISGNDSCKSQATAAGVDPTREPMYPRLAQMLAEVQQVTGVQIHYLLACYIQSSSEMLTYHSALPSQTQKIHESQLSDVINSYAPGLLFVSGHSYGGWLALQVASDLTQVRRLSGLFTIDPISANLCKKVGAVGCQRFPGDFTENELSYISTQTDIWDHYFQRITPLLRSGPTAFAHTSRNVLIPHWNIDVSPQVWAGITAGVIARLQP